jgi:hypothetical protein
MDYVMVFTENPEEQPMHLTLVLHKLKEFILPQPCRCNFGTAKLEFLGHSFSNVGINPCPVESVISGSQCLTDLR